MHHPGIEPRANAWKAFMLPLHQWCLMNITGLLKYMIINIIIIFHLQTNERMNQSIKWQNNVEPM